MTGHSGNSAPHPPPPGPAQALAAKLGYTVYEGGGSIFSAPVLVFLGRDRGKPSEYDVFDHVDRPLGYCRQLPGSMLRVESPCQIYDPFHAPLLQARPTSGLFRISYQINGVTSALFTGPVIVGKEITIERNSEPFGYVRGPGPAAKPAARAEVLDHNRQPVAELRVIEERTLFAVKRRDMVINIDPMLGGELRRLLIALPMVMDQIRQRNESNG